MWNTANLDAQLADEHATVGGVVLGIAHDLVLAVGRIIAGCDDGVSLAEARGVLVNDLLCEPKEDGDDDGGLEGFAEDDEENGDGKEIFAHGGSKTGDTSARGSG